MLWPVPTSCLKVPFDWACLLEVGVGRAGRLALCMLSLPCCHLEQPFGEPLCAPLLCAGLFFCLFNGLLTALAYLFEHLGPAGNLVMFVAVGALVRGASVVVSVWSPGTV